MNSASITNIIGSLVYSNHVKSGTPQQSPHTLPFEGMDNWNKNMEYGPGKGSNTIQKSFKAISNYLK